MSLQELRDKIVEKVMLQKSDKKLSEILELLNSESPDKELNLSQHYDKVKQQFGEALQELAK